MGKSELIDKISKVAEINKKDVKAIIDVLPDVIKETVVNGDTINLVGFMTVSKKHVPAKSGVTKLKGVEKSWTTDERDEIAIKLSKSYKVI